MFVINDDGSIYLTRGDIAIIEVSAKKSETEDYTFKVGDIVRFNVFEKKRCDNVVLQKEVEVEEECTSVIIELDRTDTKLGELIHKPKDYWYEVELNPETTPQTIVGYDSEGPKILRLFPEGDENL
jgi:hypothetical protein